MERLRHRDGVDPAVRERDALGRPREHRDRRHAPLQLGAHLAQRLDRDDVRAARDEQPGQLPGARGEVEHGAARAQLELLDDARDRRGRIVGPPALVDVGGGEAARCRMELRHDPRRRPS